MKNMISMKFFIWLGSALAIIFLSPVVFCERIPVDLRNASPRGGTYDWNAPSSTEIYSPNLRASSGPTESSFSISLPRTIRAGDRLEFTWSAGNLYEGDVILTIAGRVVASRNSSASTVIVPIGATGSITVSFRFNRNARGSSTGSNATSYSQASVRALTLVTDDLPQVISPSVSASGFNAAVVSFSTNTPTYSQIRYGEVRTDFQATTGKRPLSVPSDPYSAPTYATSHSTLIPGLVPGQPYQFQIVVYDQRGNIGYSGILYVDTPPSLSVSRNTAIGTVTVSWNYPANGWTLQASNNLFNWTPVNLAAKQAEGMYEIKGVSPHRYYYVSYTPATGPAAAYFRLVKTSASLASTAGNRSLSLSAGANGSGFVSLGSSAEIRASLPSEEDLSPLSSRPGSVSGVRNLTLVSASAIRSFFSNAWANALNSKNRFLPGSDEESSSNYLKQIAAAVVDSKFPELLVLFYETDGKDPLFGSNSESVGGGTILRSQGLLVTAPRRGSVTQ